MPVNIKSPLSCPQSCPLIAFYSCNAALFPARLICGMWPLQPAGRKRFETRVRTATLGQCSWHRRPHVLLGWLPLHTEERGVVTVNSPDTGMHRAVKHYTAPFITAPRAQQGHKYHCFPPTCPVPQTDLSILSASRCLILLMCFNVYKWLSNILAICHWCACQ